MVKTKVVELEILYRTGVTRRSRSRSDDSLCPKYFLLKKSKKRFLVLNFFEL